MFDMNEKLQLLHKYLNDIANAVNEDEVTRFFESYKNQRGIHSKDDVIQSFYSAKPYFEVIEAIPDEIRQEFKLYQRERQDNQGLQRQNMLDNVHLLNVKNRPCIDLGENSDVTPEGNGMPCQRIYRSRHRFDERQS